MERLEQLSYLPFIGWIFPMAKKSKDNFAMHHAKQAFVMAIFFTLILISLSFLNILLPSPFKIIKLLIIAIIYLLYLLYFTMCIVGTIMVKKNKFGEFPVIKNHIHKINI